jgi:hypothetical protein
MDLIESVRITGNGDIYLYGEIVSDLNSVKSAIKIIHKQLSLGHAPKTDTPNPTDDGRASARPVHHVVGQTLPEQNHA